MLWLGCGMRGVRGGRSNTNLACVLVASCSDALWCTVRLGSEMKPYASFILCTRSTPFTTWTSWFLIFDSSFLHSCSFASFSNLSCLFRNRCRVLLLFGLLVGKLCPFSLVAGVKMASFLWSLYAFSLEVVFDYKVDEID